MSGVRNVTTSAAILGQVFAKLRAEKGLKQSDLATALDVKPSSWSRIEKGDTSISLDQLKLAASALGQTTSQIIELAEEAEKEAIKRGVAIENSDWFKKFMANYGGNNDVTISDLPLGASVIPLLGAALGGMISITVAAYLEIKKEK